MKSWMHGGSPQGWVDDAIEAVRQACAATASGRRVRARGSSSGRCGSRRSREHGDAGHRRRERDGAHDVGGDQHLEAEQDRAADVVAQRCDSASALSRSAAPRAQATGRARSGTPTTRCAPTCSITACDMAACRLTACASSSSRRRPPSARASHAASASAAPTPPPRRPAEALEELADHRRADQAAGEIAREVHAAGRAGSSVAARPTKPVAVACAKKVPAPTQASPTITAGRCGSSSSGRPMPATASDARNARCVPKRAPRGRPAAW